MVLYLDAFRPEKGVRTPQGSFNPNEFGSLKPGEWTIPLTEEILDSVGKDVRGPDRFLDDVQSDGVALETLE